MPAKTKPDRNNRCSVEITDSVVRVIRINRKGKIQAAAEVEISGLPEAIDKEYVDVLSRIIKKASREAKVPLAVGLPCAVVTGGPHVIIRRFTWPEMNGSAISINARQEIAAYLPGDPSLFTVHHRVLKYSPKTETSAPSIDVMVAAIPTDLASALISAVSKSGFHAKRLEVRENARGKLAEVLRGNIKVKKPDTDEITQENPSIPVEDLWDKDFSSENINIEAAYIEPNSFVILDVTNPQINISLYLDGIFYSNRYFTAQMGGEGPYDTDALANEVSSVIDYIQYRERGSVMQCVMMLGEEENLPGITQSLNDNLDIPIFSTADWVGENLLHEKLTGIKNMARFLDAYGAALPAAQGFSDINIAPERTLSKSAQAAIPIIITSVAVGAAALAAILVPNGLLSARQFEILSLEQRLNDFAVQQGGIDSLNEEIALVMESISIEEDRTAGVQKEIYTLLNRIYDVEGFFKQYQQAGTVIPAIREVEQSSAGQVFESVSVSPDGFVSINGTARDLRQVANDITKFLESNNFTAVYSNRLSSMDDTSVTFDLTLRLVPREVENE